MASETLTLIAPVERCHRKIDRQNAIRSRCLPHQTGWQVVTFQMMCVQGVTAEYFGVSGMRGDPKPGEITGLLLPRSPLEKIVQPVDPTTEGFSFVLARIRGARCKTMAGSRQGQAPRATPARYRATASRKAGVGLGRTALNSPEPAGKVAVTVHQNDPRMAHQPLLNSEIWNNPDPDFDHM